MARSDDVWTVSLAMDREETGESYRFEGKVTIPRLRELAQELLEAADEIENDKEGSDGNDSA